ncbi:hypothetical protein L6452_01755 [Arctium lappa]|uniref:Uncharacterized protein n=1 Tax=Arctium lappa TaxID=4217 RepID=A0ACB9FIB8_ARCLA|nr:hypothetical protein L6452_01755 [Arctium lappa]
MLFPVDIVSILQKDSWLSPNTSDSGIIDFQITWIREIPLLLTLLGDENPSLSKVVLRLQLHLGQCVIMNSPFSQELDRMQYSLYEYLLIIFFFLTRNISYGPFMKLGTDIQELSVCCLYYFSFLGPSLLQSLATCCLYLDSGDSSLNLECFLQAVLHLQLHLEQYVIMNSPLS